MTLTGYLDAIINASASGDNTVIAAPGAGIRIIVFSYTLLTATATGCKWKSASTDKSGVMPIPAGGGAAPSAPMGLFECGSNEALILNLDAGNLVAGHLRYALRS